MQVQAIPLTEFVHGSITAYQGKPLMLNDSLAHDLERRGLVRINLTPTKTPVVESGKAQDDGRGLPSSASPVAQALAMGTLHLSKPGGAKLHKAGK